jgi:hypothetical protein
MKEWRIVQLYPSMAIVNVRRGNKGPYCGYTDRTVAERDLNMLRQAYPVREFEVVEYIELDVAIRESVLS